MSKTKEKFRNNATSSKIDWFRENKVEVYEDEIFGDGIRSLITSKLNSNQKKFQYIAYKMVGEELTEDELHTRTPQQLAYVITIHDDKKQAQAIHLDLSENWLGKINHAPDELANAKAYGTHLIQYDDIYAGDAITYDYGLDYWVFQITHLDWEEEWKVEDAGVVARAQALFQQMHSEVLNYAILLAMNLHTMKHNKNKLLDQLEEYLNSNDHKLQQLTKVKKCAKSGREHDQIERDLVKNSQAIIKFVQESG
jgi:hypothetical protein